MRARFHSRSDSHHLMQSSFVNSLTIMRLMLLHTAELNVNVSQFLRCNSLTLFNSYEWC
jgi:hypothetical protein